MVQRTYRHSATAGTRDVPIGILLRALLLEWKVACPRRDGELHRVLPGLGNPQPWPLLRIGGGRPLLHWNFRRRFWAATLAERLITGFSRIADPDQRAKLFKSIQPLLNAREHAQRCALGAVRYVHPRMVVETAQMKSHLADRESLAAYQLEASRMKQTDKAAASSATLISVPGRDEPS